MKRAIAGLHWWRCHPGALALVAWPVLALCFGCPLPLGTTADGEVTGDTGVGDTSGNSSLNTATALNLAPTDDEQQFSGTIIGTTDIDVYALGTLAPGDRLFVDVQRVSGNLDPVAAIFDSSEHLVAFNDDRAADGSNLNPRIDIVIRGDADTYFLGIIAYPGNFTSGDYQAFVRVQRDTGVPSPQPQIVFLNWAGGEDILIENVGSFTVSTFSAADVGLPAEQTSALKDRVQEIVAERYEGLNLIVLNSDDNPEPAGAHSTIYFGGHSFDAFAISEQVDTFNEDPSDDAIIFTASYRNVFRTDPTFEQMAQALGNTIAHEVGHLLGLVHTHDCDSLMDTTCYNERLLSSQEFKLARLDDSVFPFGWQDATEILGWLLGFVGL